MSKIQTLGLLQTFMIFDEPCDNIIFFSHYTSQDIIRFSLSLFISYSYLNLHLLSFFFIYFLHSLLYQFLLLILTSPSSFYSYFPHHNT